MGSLVKRLPLKKRLLLTVMLHLVSLPLAENGNLLEAISVISVELKNTARANRDP